MSGFNHMPVFGLEIQAVNFTGLLKSSYMDGFLAEGCTTALLGNFGGFASADLFIY